MKLLKIFLLACMVMVTGIYGAEENQSNILWHNSTTGAVKFMPINNMIPENTLPVVDSSNTNLLPKGIGDFTGDGKPDILFHNQNSGNLRIWEMNGAIKVDNILVLGSSNTNLMIAGVGDFDQDGDNDIATFNTNSGALRMWVMEGTVRVDNVLVLTGANTNLVPRGAGDMDGDGIPDLVLRNNNSGAVRIWTMNSNFTRKGNEYIRSSSNTNLEIRGVVDINGDGNNDILNYNTSTGVLRAWLMDGNLSIIENATIVQDDDLDWSVRGGDNNTPSNTASANITEEGGTLRVSDEYGNTIKVNFPSGAVMETTQVFLTLSPSDMDLPIAERRTPVFEIRPSDISLYKPVAITVEYNTTISEIKKTGLFRVRTESWLTPLSDHTYADDNNSMTATTIFLGDFAEGKMTLDQLNTQFDLLVASLGIVWDKVNKVVAMSSEVSCNTRILKAIWDDSREAIGALLTIFDARNEHGYYSDPSDPEKNTFMQDQVLLCTNVVNPGIQMVLDQCIPDDICDNKDYKHTIGDMLLEANKLGCDEGDTFNLLQERFDQMITDCGAYLEIDSELDVGPGILLMSTSGVVPLTMRTGSTGGAIIEGFGTLRLSGGGGFGECDSVVTGVVMAGVLGTRDGDNNYELTVLLEQCGDLTTTCPGDIGTTETPLAGSERREAILNSANGYTQTIEEPVEGGGLYTITVRLFNPTLSL